MFRPEGIYRLRAPCKATTLVYRLKIFQRDSDKLLLILLIHQTWPCIIGPKQHSFLGNNLSSGSFMNCARFLPACAKLIGIGHLPNSQLFLMGSKFSETKESLPAAWSIGYYTVIYTRLRSSVSFLWGRGYVWDHTLQRITSLWT